MTRFIFNDKITENYIVIVKENNECWMEKYYLDSENVKLFVATIKEAFDKIKKEGCDKFIQYVDKCEWDGFLKTNKKWSILNDENGIMLICCNIDDAVECIVRGFGFVCD